MNLRPITSAIATAAICAAAFLCLCGCSEPPKIERGKFPLPAGAEIFDGSEKVGEVVVSAESPTLSANIGLGLFSKDYAVSGFDFSLSPDSPATVSTVSRPFVFAASLERGMEE